MNEDLARKLRRLRLYGLLTHWDDYMTMAQKRRFSPVRLLTHIVAEEYRIKGENARERRLAQARIPEVLVMETVVGPAWCLPLVDTQRAVPFSETMTESLMKTWDRVGVDFWQVGNQRKALSWWQKGIQDGEMRGFRPDLARIYFEVAKHLLHPQSKQKRLGEISAEQYLVKARTMFQEMDLQWDLEELESISATN